MPAAGLGAAAWLDRHGIVLVRGIEELGTKDVGAGNSAGQAVMFLAECCPNRRVPAHTACFRFVHEAMATRIVLSEELPAFLNALVRSHRDFAMATFTLVHVAISLVAIVAGFVVLYGMLVARRLDGWTALFLATTVLTSVTGFGFPFERFLPSHAIGIISLVILALAIYARYARRLGDGWRRTYVIIAVIALYFNVFVLVVQAFLKVPALHALAPTQSEPPFAIAQFLVLAAFIVFGVLAAKRFQVASASPS